MTTYTIAVIGCGIGRLHIAEGYTRHPDKFRVTTICDLDEARIAKIGDEFAIPRRTTSFDEVLAMDVDIVDICTPPTLHLAQTLATLAAGLVPSRFEGLFAAYHAALESGTAFPITRADARRSLERATAGACC